MLRITAPLRSMGRAVIWLRKQAAIRSPMNGEEETERLRSDSPAEVPIGQPTAHADGDADRPLAKPTSDGINASQRTPLEAHFHTCMGRE